jgi:hypothetical protein
MFRRVRQPEPSPSAAFCSSVAGILSAYGTLLEQYPLAIVDVSHLPADKRTMGVVFRAAWYLADSAQERRAIEVGWVSLSNFQEGVGIEPLSLPDFPDVPSVEAANKVDLYLSFARLAAVESEAIIRELRTLRIYDVSGSAAEAPSL